MVCGLWFCRHPRSQADSDQVANFYVLKSVEKSEELSYTQVNQRLSEVNKAARPDHRAAQHRRHNRCDGTNGNRRACVRASF